MSRVRASVFITAMLSLSTAYAERLPVRSYSMADGLPHDRVKRIIQDSHGFLWFCTPFGVTRFDGYTFRTFTTEDGLPFASTWDVLEDREGNYWVATYGGGVAKIDPRRPHPSEGSFTSFRVGATHNTNRVKILRQEADGAIYAGTENGVFLLEPGAKELARFDLSVQTSTQPRVRAFATDDSGALWIGTSRGLFRRAAGAKKAEKIEAGLANEDIFTLLIDRRRRLWIGHMKGVDRFDLETRDAKHLALPKVETRALLESSDGRVWIATLGAGLHELNDDQVRSWGRLDGLTDDRLITLQEDRSSNLWIGTESSGAMRVSLGGFVAFDERDGLEHDRKGSLFSGPNGDVYVVSGPYVHRFDGGRFHAVSPSVPLGGLEFEATRRALIDRQGDWWLATSEGLARFVGLERFEELATAKPSLEQGLPPGAIAALFEDSRGDLWISIHGKQPIVRRDRISGAFEPFPIGTYALSFVEDHSGAVWAGLRDGTVARLRDGGFEVFGPDDGVPRGGWPGLFVDRAGRLWIATMLSALRVEDPTQAVPVFESMGTKEGLSQSATRCFAEDERGRLFVGTVDGVDRLDPETSNVRHYSRFDGLGNLETYTALRDREGAIWFSTLRGVSRIEPTPEAGPIVPKTRLMGLRIQGAMQPLSIIGDTTLDDLVLAHDASGIELHFVSPASSEPVRYQYYLEGADDDWAPRSTARSVTYPYLSAGSYQFKVRAIAADGTAGPVSKLSLMVDPPFYRRVWFIALMMIAFVSAALLLHRYRVARLVEIEQIRTRIAADLHDDIGASLSHIAILSEVIRRDADETAAGPLDRIASSSRDLVDAMADIVWAVDPKRDRVGDLTQRMRRFATEALSSAGVELTFSAPSDQAETRLRADVRREVFLIFKESTNNIVKHARARHAKITLTLNEARIQLLIEDDGSGFDPAASSDGHGLGSMRRRARALGADLVIESVNGRGTRVALEATRLGRRS